MRSVSYCKVILACLCLFFASAAAQAGTISFKVSVDGVQSGSGSPSAATALMLFDTATSNLSWNIGAVAPPFATRLRFAHFHGPAPIGNNAGVQLWICDNLGVGPAGTPACGLPATPLAMGSAVLTAAQANDLRAGLWYINVHTDAFPAGEIRGQVVPTPVPATFGLLVLGTLLLGIRRRAGG